MIRSTVAVILGYCIWTALWLAFTLGLQAAMPEAIPSEGPVSATNLLLAVLGISVVCSMAAGLSAKQIVRSPSNKAVMVMSLLLLATGIGVQSGEWERMPVWYHLAFLALLVPGCLVGARIARRD